MGETDRKTAIGGPWSRRRFLRTGAAALTLPVFGRLPSLASPALLSEPLPPDRNLSFFNTHTGEELATTYCQSGCYSPPALERINHILRDHRTGESREIDVRLLDLLNALSRRTGAGEPFHIISGYRSSRTNASLRARGGGVAEHSLHLLGQAVDIRVPGIGLRDLYRAALSLRGGGVGIYPKSGFIHVDVGRVRTW